MSLGLTALNLGLRLFAKPYLRRADDPITLRTQFEHDANLLFRAPPFMCAVPDRLADLPALWVSCGHVKQRPVILYLHGGAYVVGSARTHAKMLARLSKLSGMRVCLPNYRLAPEAPFPAAFDDARKAYDALIARGYTPENIAIGGDSAGGGLALALLGTLCRAGTSPKAAFAFSPWVDLAMEGRSLRENAQSDPLLPVSRIMELRDMILQGAPPKDPRISPLYGAFPACPPVYLQSSDSEILRDDARRMARWLLHEGADVTLDNWRNTPHVWQMFDGWLPEARAALQKTAAFLKRQFP